MEIKVLGPGCAKCEATKKLISEVAVEMGVEVKVEAVKDLMKITEYDILSTPGVVIDGKVVSSGKIPTRDEIRNWIQEKKLE
ncbi:MAG TPA: thioredoxin family protein [Candidatus Anoxymicrobiaceae bacterium]